MIYGKTWIYYNELMITLKLTKPNKNSKLVGNLRPIEGDINHEKYIHLMVYHRLYKHNE